MEAPEAAAQLEAGAAVAVDVREPREWKAGHLRMARHVPLSELALRMSELPRDRTIVVVCRSGNRSRVATLALRRAGYDAENLEGGLKAWQAAGLVLEPPNGRVA
jgi:rhodanese-related sulfurtransferase